MSLETVTEKTWWLETLNPRCFFCGDPLPPVFVFWQGANGDHIALHEECANKLAVHLLSDAAKIRLGDRP